MTNRIEYIGIAVSDLTSAEKLYTDILGVEPYKRESRTSKCYDFIF